MSRKIDDLNSDGSPVEFWFNTKTGEVEEGRLSAAPYRVGPFKSKDEAERALELLAERSRLWASEEEAD
jgi:hypothetical protein